MVNAIHLKPIIDLSLFLCGELPAEFSGPIQFPSTGRSISLDGLKVIIVEDERLVAEDVKEKLVRWGCKVLAIAASGNKAIEAVSANLPELILMDIRLKGNMDGIQTAIEIQNRFKPVPIVFLSAHFHEQFFGLEFLDSRFYTNLSKPYEAKQLYSAIIEVISKASGQ